MVRIMHLFAAFVLIALLIAGCSNNSTPVSPNNSDENQLVLGKIILPESAVFESATLYLYLGQPSGQTINIHRIENPWEEMTVTWNSFGGTFAPDIYGTFIADEIGWKSVDVSSLVMEWMNGTHENYGLLLDQVEFAFPNTKFASREMVELAPYLSFCYSTTDGSTCETILPIGDTYIYETYPEVNYGDNLSLRTGWDFTNELEKQSLLIFEVPDMPVDQGGCTLTIGYWKNHAGFGPQADMVSPLLPIWLGLADGDRSVAVLDATTAVNVLKMKTYGSPSNGITKLYAQLLGAKLNIVNGADDSDIANIIADADDFLAAHDWNDWKSLGGTDKNMVLDWMNSLDDYNNGLIGPGHCE